MKTLFRPVNKVELDLIQASNWQAFPPRLPEQPIFYPVMNQAYATQITVEWNLTAYGNGFVVAFDLPEDYLRQYPVQNVGGELHNEIWVPAEELDAFNQQIIGDIRVVEGYHQSPNSCYLFLEDKFKLSNGMQLISVYLLDEKFTLHLDKAASVNGYPLNNYLDLPRKKGIDGQLMTNVVVLQVKEQTDFNQLQARSIVLFQQE